MNSFVYCFRKKSPDNGMQINIYEYQFANLNPLTTVRAPVPLLDYIG